MNKTPHCLICLGVREVVLQHWRVKQEDFCSRKLQFEMIKCIQAPVLRPPGIKRQEWPPSLSFVFFFKGSAKQRKFPVKFMSWSMTTSGVCFIFLDINIDPPNWQSPSFFVGRCPSSRIFFLSVRTKTHEDYEMHAICLWAPAQEAERPEKGEKGRTPGNIETDGVVQKTVHSGL